jgi:hypothetical protein
LERDDAVWLDAALFPDADTLARCHVLRDLGSAESRLSALDRSLGDGDV